MHKKHPHKHHQNHSHRPKKKKLGLFYGATSSILLIGFIAIFYFAVLVSTKPRSILLVTQKIESSLQKKFGEENVSIEKSYLGFTNYGTLKITLTGLRILYSDSDGSGKKSFIIPHVETEFALLDFLRLRFQPSKIKIANPNIFLGDWQKIVGSTPENAEKQNDLAAIAALFASIRDGKNPIENLEIENAKLLLRMENFDREFLLKKSQIHLTSKNITSQNQLSLDEEEADVSLSSNCQISENVICDISLQNLSPDSIAELHPSLSQLSQINAALNANISFAFRDQEFNDLKFKIHSEKGDFEFLDFFAKKMEFRNFSVAGEYDHNSKIINLSTIESDFDKAHLSMSLMVSGTEDKKLDFNIRLQNVAGDEVEKFWPVTLKENGIRDWVKAHIGGGVVSDAYTKFSLSQIKGEFFLDDINAEMSLTGINVNYSKDFPAVKNVSATANFTKRDMKITVTNAEVLQSKISDGLVAIDDFDAANVILKISGKTSGHAANGLQHAHNHPDFTKEVAKYLNGEAQGNFDVRLSLSHEITLKNSYIAANSTVLGLSNDYLHGDVVISSKKDFGSTDFITNLNLTNAELTAPQFDLVKKSGSESQLGLIVSVPNSPEIRIKNISLWKKEEKNSLEKFSGDLAFKTAPALLTSANFRNVNFNKNSYTLAYFADPKTNSRRVSWQGNRLNLGAFLAQKSGNKNFPNLNLQIAANRVELLRGKSLRSFYLALNCTNGLCAKGVVNATYSKKQMLNLRVEKTSGNNLINGRIGDVGYLAEGLGISNVVVGGDAKVQIQHFASENKPVFKGTLTIDNDITIFENEAVKRFGKDTLFSQIRDKIFSSEKTTFDSVKLEFHLQNSKLDIRSLVANNFKIGITAKGEINLADKSMHLKGMIVPGFIVNNLFGIGKIPLVGGVVSGLLTGGEGGGLFGISYKYDKNPGDKEGEFTTNKVAAFVPSTIQNLFD